MDKPREKRSGCVIALMVLAGLAVVAIVLVAVGIYLFLRTDEGKRIYASLSDSASLSLKATRGPGIKELHAIGCETPMILTIGEWRRLESSMASLANESSEFDVADDVVDVPLVQCYASRAFEGLPSCDDLATTYAGAIESPPERFIVLAHVEGEEEESGEIVCTGYYDASGARIGDLGENFTLVPGR